MRPIALLIALTMLAFVAGCGGSPEPPVDDPQSAASQPAEDPLVGVAPANVVSLEPAEKREILGESFPAEVPVPQGEFIETGDQEEAWTYTAIVDHPTDGLAAWYRKAYTARNWEVVSQAGAPDGAYVLNFYKGGAQSHIRIIHDAAGKSRVEVVVGVGPDVLSTQ